MGIYDIRIVKERSTCFCALGQGSICHNYSALRIGAFFGEALLNLAPSNRSSAPVTITKNLTVANRRNKPRSQQSTCTTVILL